MRLIALIALCFAVLGYSEKGYAGPKLSISPEVMDFGTVSVYGVCEGTFNLKNSGDSDLNLKLGQYSCSCLMENKIGKNTLSPGENAELHIVYRPMQLGAANGYITIESNSDSPKTVLYIEANSVLDPEVKPQLWVDLGLMFSGEWKETSFSLVSKQPIEISEMDCEDLNIDKDSVQIVSIPEGKRVRFRSKLDQKPAKGDSCLDLATNLKKTPRLKIPLLFKYKKNIECIPSSLYIMKNEASNTKWVKKGSVVFNSKKKNLKEVQVLSKEVEVKIESSSEEKIEFSVHPTSAFKSDLKEIEVFFLFEDNKNPVACRIIVVDI